MLVYRYRHLEYLPIIFSCHCGGWDLATGWELGALQWSASNKGGTGRTGDRCTAGSMALCLMCMHIYIYLVPLYERCSNIFWISKQVRAYYEYMELNCNMDIKYGYEFDNMIFIYTYIRVHNCKPFPSPSAVCWLFLQINSQPPRHMQQAMPRIVKSSSSTIASLQWSHAYPTDSRTKRFPLMYLW